MDIYEFMRKLQRFNVETCPGSAEDLCTLLFQHEEDFLYPGFNGSKFTLNGTPIKKEKSILIAFSGGLKSIATTFFYKNLDYDIKLVYFKEGKETTEAVKKLAEKFELPLIIQDNVKSKNCLRNIEIATRCVKLAIEEQLSLDIAFGCLYNVSLVSNRWITSGSETIEMWTAYEKVMSEATGLEFKIRRPLPTTAYMWEVLLVHPSYLDVADTYKPYADIVRADHGQIELSKQRYMSNLYLVKQKYFLNTGIMPKDNQDLWKKCFFYSIRKSIYYESL